MKLLKKGKSKNDIWVGECSNCHAIFQAKTNEVVRFSWTECPECFAESNLIFHKYSDKSAQLILNKNQLCIDDEFEEDSVKELTKFNTLHPIKKLTKFNTLHPIETAPKDGTYVLLFGESGYTTTPLRCCVGHYDAEYRPLSPWQTHSNDPFEDGGDPPIYWMELP